jgi:FixJ family two-component response regulator
MMPGMTGTDLARALNLMRPDLPIVLTSGQPDTLLPDRLRALGIRQLLAKPISMQMLAETVHQVLSTSSPLD